VNGQTTGSISSTLVGDKVVSATIDGTIAVTQTATVSVTEPLNVDAFSEILPVNSSINVIITGSGFAAGVSVTLENGSGPAPTVSNVVWLSATSITATFTAKAGGPRRDRLWDVRVTNPDGTSVVVPGGLTVDGAR
jgi:hypothetical protein